MRMTDPPPPNEPAPWTGLEIAAALFLIYLFWPFLSLQLLSASGLAERLYGPDAAALLRPAPEGNGNTRADEGDSGQALRLRLNTWNQALAFPLQAVTVPVVFYAFRGVPPWRLGLTTWKLGPNVLAGVGAWLLITPLVFAVHLAVVYFYDLTDPGAIHEHALTKFALHGPTRLEWALIVFSAVVAAPVVEEIVFRGAIQPWFAGRRSGGHGAMAAALAAAVVMSQPPLGEALREGPVEVIRAASPALFVLALVPFYLAVCRRPPRPDSPAVFGTAVLFAMAHTPIWPTPVPLFVLGLGLGSLASRTRSLVGPIVLHGLFNAVTCVMLLLGWGGA